MHGCVHAYVQAWFRQTRLAQLYTNDGAGLRTAIVSYRTSAYSH